MFLVCFLKAWQKLVFLFPLRWDRKAKESWEKSPYPNWCKTLANLFLWIRDLCLLCGRLWAYVTKIILPLLPEPPDIFLGSSLWESGRFLDVKAKEAFGPPKTGTRSYLFSRWSALSLQQLTMVSIEIFFTVHGSSSGPVSLYFVVTVWLATWIF